MFQYYSVIQGPLLYENQIENLLSFLGEKLQTLKGKEVLYSIKARECIGLSYITVESDDLVTI